MPLEVLIAHAEGEEAEAERLAGPIRNAGYNVVHQGTVLVGESIVEGASRPLAAGCAVVLCGTVRAIGTGWAHRILNAARQRPEPRILAVSMEQDAYLDQLSLGGRVASYWQDPEGAVSAILASLRAMNGNEDPPRADPGGERAEARYRELALELCDIIDLGNLPEDDRHIATRQLELRRLYVALRVQVELSATDEPTGEHFAAIESRRAVRGADSTAMGDPWLHEADRERVPIGNVLARSRRVVVLGDPGAGKTTMVRWIATAYLLRLKNDPASALLPDVATLPDEDLLPIVVRCRDLDGPCLSGSFRDVIRQSLAKAELTDAEFEALWPLLRDKLNSGHALVMLDGLDEIVDPSSRAGFCRQIEQLHIAYPDAPILATSRVVGYREMGHRLGRGFEHVTVADLSREDKDDFAERWCTLTELPGRRKEAADELIRDIHGTDRIERLTGNPMLLTTMALVKRKVGKLPNRRADLYFAAVEVLLNWRREVDAPLDQREALPQLEYLAYAMCDRGVQQAREDEVLGLFERMREEYDRVRPARARSPEEFLQQLERRTGILVETGRVPHRGTPVPVYEFRHLTFQEYLAALALVAGHFPDRDVTTSLASAIAPLAGRTSVVRDPVWGTEELAVTETWREVLLLAITMCNDDDADDVLKAILSPDPDADRDVTARPRAVLAARCLADEPNVSDQTAVNTITTLLSFFEPRDGELPVRTGLSEAVAELSRSRWYEEVSLRLADRFASAGTADQDRLGALCGLASATHSVRPDWVEERIADLGSTEMSRQVRGALGIMYDAFQRDRHGRDLVRNVVDLLMRGVMSARPAVSHACAWALAWMNHPDAGRGAWTPSDAEGLRLVKLVRARDTPRSTLRYVCWIVGRAGLVEARDPLVNQLSTRDPELRRAIFLALAEMDDPIATAAVRKYLGSRSASVRRMAVGALAQASRDATAQRVLQEPGRGVIEYRDPHITIDSEDVDSIAERIGMEASGVRQQLEGLREVFKLRLGWVGEGAADGDASARQSR